MVRNYIKCEALNRKPMSDNQNCQFSKTCFARNCTKCQELYRKVMFVNPPPPWDGINFKIKFSFLVSNKMSRTSQKNYFLSLHLHMSVRVGVDGIKLQKIIARNGMKCLNLYRKIMFASSLPSLGWTVSIQKYFFLKFTWNIQSCTEKYFLPQQPSWGGDISV